MTYCWGRDLIGCLAWLSYVPCAGLWAVLQLNAWELLCVQELSGTIVKLQDMCLHRNEQTLKARDETVAALDQLNAARCHSFLVTAAPICYCFYLATIGMHKQVTLLMGLSMPCRYSKNIPREVHARS